MRWPRFSGSRRARKSARSLLKAGCCRTRSSKPNQCTQAASSALKSHWSKSSSTLYKVDFWLWRVGRFTPLFELAGPQLLRTHGEKAKHKRTQFKRLRKGKEPKKRDEKQLTKPVLSLLRPDNIVGGGFTRTGAGAAPKFVREYWGRFGAIASDGHDVVQGVH